MIVSRWRAAWAWVGHYGGLTWWAATVLYAARMVWPNATLFSWLMYPVLTVLIVNLFSERRHGARCARCTGGVRPDGYEVARRRRRWLWAAHRHPAPSVFLATLVLFVLSFSHPECWVVIYGVFAMTETAIVAHRGLELWCPWCGRDDGDGGVGAPEPDPAGSGSRS